jgi:hypothetical protein
MEQADGLLCEVNGQVFRCYRNGDLWRRSKTGEYRLVRNVSNIGNGYCTVIGNKKKYKYHRIMYLAFNPTFNIYDTSLMIDHMDGNRLNNSLTNLRQVTRQENQHNMTNAKGYSFHKKCNKYQAKIRITNKLIHLGLFKTRWEARQAYLDAIPIYHPSTPVHLYTNDEDDKPIDI